MLQTKKLNSFFHNQNIDSHSQHPQSSFHLKRCQSNIIQKSPIQHIDLNIATEETFKCYQCTDKLDKNYLCSTCNGKGYVQSENALVKLMNEIFNTRILQSGNSKNQFQKDLVSTKNSSSSNISDSIPMLDQMNNSILKKTGKTSQIKNRKSQQKNSILQFIKTPLQQIIKQQSSCFEDKCQKCNICHYQFDNIKYTCQQCENYNVCEQCYSKKRIIHCHNLKKIQSISSKKASNNQDDQRDRNLAMRCSLQNCNFDDQNTHSEVEKVELMSNQSDQQQNKQVKQMNQQKTRDQKLILENKSEEKRENSEKFLKGQNSKQVQFFKLRQIQCSQKQQKQPNFKNKQNILQLNQSQNCCKKLCKNCNLTIQECYWICQTCQQQSKEYQICKTCYDNGTFQHQKSHNLGLNFFSLDQSLFQNQDYLFDNFNQDFEQQHGSTNTQKKDRPINSNKNGKPLLMHQFPSNSSSMISHKSQPDIFNIGVVHKNIFSGFHKQQGETNQHYHNQIISPIPRSIPLARPFKESKNCCLQSNQLIMPQIMAETGISAVDIKKIYQRAEKADNKGFSNNQNTKEAFIDQSRVLFDDVSMDFSASINYNQLIRKSTKGSKHDQLKKSIRNYLNKSNLRDSISNTSNLRDSVTSIHKLSQINPQNQYLGEQIQEDYNFVDFCCDICSVSPIVNVKYHCRECQDYDLCEQCYMNKREQHWHEHFRKDDGKMKSKKTKVNKQKIIRKALEQNNSILSPTRRSIRLIK